MSINIGPPAIEELRPRIVVIGVGGAGGNAIANMIQAQIEGVDFVVANTDAQALNNSIAETRIQLGPEITQGLGAGARPEVGRAAAEETIEDLERLLEGVHMVFIAAGMGGGTGTGAAPIIAEAARAKGVLTVGVVSKPFMFEGTRRMRAADAGIEELQKHVDTLIVIPNQNLFLVAKADTTFKEAFSLADEVLQQGVRSITDLMIMPGLINLDFADVRSVMGEMGKAMMGTGEGEGPNRALEAAERAIANPLLDGVSMQGAKGVIISIIGGDDMKLLEVDEAANHIRELVDPDANIIWGSAFNPDLQGKIRVSVVATGIEQTTEMAEIASRPLNLGASRGPVRPAVQAPASNTFQPAPAAPVQSPVQSQPAPYAAAAEPYEPTTELELGAADEAREEPAPAAFGGLRGGFSEPLELGLDEQAEPVPVPAPTPAPAAQRPRMQDELRLDGGQQVPASQPVQPAAQAPVSPRPKPAAGGSTLFERMTSLSRPRPGAAEPTGEDDDGDAGSISIPRFLGRQNNQ
ncbi:cell division protein FtsZ [Novosphingobium sp. FGD1]|jgi:cell division protein FtsZ|uniref:Cell division protein FtsZ n=1 Tax=Novosphingobium silvae TaxID=2692619 RepID=A0A7X4GFL0_9SPHN|nr:cell division protein FtsZ [Novosphingobium silvae]MYL97698.1 cell division protein FtsZ [Novosphingobium silvae]